MPAAGHINPTLPLVRELCGRGHHVSYATGAQFAPAIEATGAKPIMLDWVLKPIPVSKGGLTTEDLANMRLNIVETTRTVLPTIERWLVLERPDLLCFDMMTLAGQLITAKLKLPAVVTVANFAGNEAFDLEAAMSPRDFNPKHPRFVEFLAARAALAVEFGLPADTVNAVGAIAPMNLVLIPREFQIAGETFDDRFRFIGPAIGTPAAAEHWEPPIDGSPVMFVSLGLAANNRPDFFALCLEAFSGTRWHVVMAVGDLIDVTQLGEIPPNFDVRPVFPQSAVLQCAAVFISQAGMGSVMDALLHEVPLAVFPQTPEQGTNAKRIRELGLGRLIETGDLSPDLLRATVDDLAADRVIHKNLAAMARHLHSAGGPTAGADAIEDFLASVD